MLESPEKIFSTIKTTEDSRYILFHAPLVISTSGLDVFNDVTFNSNGLLKYLISIGEVYLMKNKMIGDVKKYVIDAIKHTTGTDKYSLLTVAFYSTFIESLRAHQQDQKLLESCMLSCAPIVPYNAPMLVKPQMTTQEGSMSSQETVTEILTNGDLNDKLIGMYGIIPWQIFDMAGSANRYYEASFDAFPTILLNDMMQIENRECSGEMYYILAYINYMFPKDNIPEVISMLSTLSNNISLISIKKMNVPEMVQSMESVLNMSDLSETSTNYAEGLKYDADRIVDDMVANAETVGDDLYANYDLDRLLAFIYTHRVYETNDYTNAMFLSDNKKVQGYSYLRNDMMVCVINDEFLCCPVIDYSDNYKMKLICINKDSNIEIKASNEFVD